MRGSEFRCDRLPKRAGRLTLRAALDDTLACVVVFVGMRAAFVGYRLDAVFLIPISDGVCGSAKA